MINDNLPVGLKCSGDLVDTHLVLRRDIIRYATPKDPIQRIKLQVGNFSAFVHRILSEDIFALTPYQDQTINTKRIFKLVLSRTMILYLQSIEMNRSQQMLDDYDIINIEEAVR